MSNFTIKRGGLDTSRFIKKGLQCDRNVFDKGIEAIKLRSPTDSEMKGEEKVELTEEQAAMGIQDDKNNRIILGIKSTKPDVLERLIKQVKAVYNVGKEVNGWSALIYGAPNAGTNSTVIENAPFGIASRYVIVVGTSEVVNFNMFANGMNCEAKKSMERNDCIMLPFGICSQLNIVFDNTTGSMSEARKGFRTKIVKKNPSYRYIVILDAHSDGKRVAKDISQSLAKENKKGPVTDTDIIAELAKKKAAEEQEREDNEVPELVSDTTVSDNLNSTLLADLAAATDKAPRESSDASPAAVATP